MDTNALFKISYGLYVLIAKENNFDNGCIINTFSQITNTPNRVAVVVNKTNKTADMIRKTGVFNVSTISESANFDLFKNFGFQSGNDVNKFVDFKDTARSNNGLLYLTKYSNSYISCKVCNTVDFDTHYMFVADLEDAEILNEEKSVTYDDYHTKIKPKPDNNKVKGYRCKICGYIYEGDVLPDNFICPLCKHGPDDFEPIK
ncbi:MAG: flavin reductase [Clostridia bacterium]|nr:flavin reductase [Clostridia bacterium]